MMVLPVNQNAIVWTETRPAVDGTFEQIHTDIQALTSWIWIERETDLAKIRKLGQNWDGFDSDAPDQSILDRAASFLRLLRERDNASPPNRIVLSPNGYVAFEWLLGDAFRRAELGDENEVEWMWVIPGRPTEFETEPLQMSSSQIQNNVPAGPVLTSSQAVQGQEWKPPKALAAGAVG
jgi:hypothetical protein